MRVGKNIFGKFSDVAIGVCGHIGDRLIYFFKRASAICVLRVAGHIFDDKETSVEFVAIVVPIVGLSRP